MSGKHRKMEEPPKWLLAQDITLETPFMSGRFIVEEVKEDGATTTYTLVRADLDPLPWVGDNYWGRPE